jgi:hypothetical protein
LIVRQLRNSWKELNNCWEELFDSPAQSFNSWRKTFDALHMFTVYALDMSGGPGCDQDVECADLDEALTHLRELVLNEMSDPDGPRFSRYGMWFETE